jgi:hypothetical protein
MDVEITYQKIIHDLAQGHRALIRFSKADSESLLELLKQGFTDHKELEKVLCLINHSAIPNLQFETELIRYLGLELPHHLTIFVLNGSRKHIIQGRGQKGLRLSFEFLEALKAKLFSPAPEVVEWTLRTIEECGAQGIYFLQEFDKIKPPPWKWFNQHQRAVREIITMLERRWRPIEKHRP